MKTAKEKQMIIESNIFAGLFKALVEQSTTLIGEFKQKQKQEFNLFLKQGWKVLNEMEKNSVLQAGYLEQLSNIYHNVNAEIKISLEKSLEDA